MLIIRLFLVVVLGVLQGACSWDVLRPPPKHGPDVLDEHIKVRQTKGIAEVAEHNHTNLQDRKFDQPVMKALPHANAGLLGDMRLSGNNAASAKRLRDASTSKAGVETVEFNFKDIELRDLLTLFFDEYLKKPYTYLDDFKDKKVNFVFNGNISHEDLIKVFTVFLNFHGVALKFNQGVYAITTSANKMPTLPSSGGVGDTVGVFKLRYMNAQDFLTAGRLLLADAQSAVVLDDLNTVFVKASQSEVAAVQQLQQSLDVAFFEDKYLLIYGPQFLKVSAAKVLIEKYEHALGSKAQHPKKRLEVETLLEESRLVIVAADKEARDLVVQFLASVDKPGPSERQMFQYPLSSQNATEVLSTVESLLKASTKNTEPVDVVADKLTNSLYVMATAEEFAEISKLLHKLDFRVPEVHIDFVVAEVALTDEIGYGVEWYLSQQAGGVLGDATMDMMKNAAVAGATSGLSLGAVALNSNKYATLKLLASTKNFKMLSNPHLLVKNDSTASISVGSNIAVPTSKTQLPSAGAITTSASTQTNYSREDVALKMEITPHISMEGVIQLKITLEDKTLQSKDDGQGNPTFLKRDMKTELVMEDSQTVLLGGLIRRAQSQLVNKVPWIGDVPYLGAIFSNNQDNEEVTELFMLITPRLVLDKEGAQLVAKALTDSSRNLLKDMDKKPPLADLNL